jgi:hypothetical protein
MIYLWILLVIPYLYCCRKIAWWMIIDFNDGNVNRIDGEDIFFGSFLGAILALAFPIIIPIMIIHRLITKAGSDNYLWLVAPKDVRRKLSEETLKERIHELEHRLLDSQGRQQLY